MTKEDLDQVMAIENASFSMPWSRNLFLAEFRNPSVSLMLVARSAAPAREILAYIVCWVFVDELHVLVLATRRDARRKASPAGLCFPPWQKVTAGSQESISGSSRIQPGSTGALFSFGFGTGHVRADYYDQPVENAVVMMLDTEGMRHCIGAGTGSFV